MRLTYHVLDVFTDTRFAGNPLAVVLDADALSADRMQAIAREFNLPETVFVMKAQARAHTARLRIFTPAAELPFAGHPTVGAAVLLAELRNPAPSNDNGGEQDSLLVLEEGIGLVRVGVRVRPGQAAFAEFAAPKLPSDSGSTLSNERLAAMLGLIPTEIGFENHKPSRFMAGNTFMFVPVASLDAIARARVVEASWDAAFAGQNLVGAYVYCRQTVHAASAFHARMFAPAMGIPEDPATGSAAVNFAGVVQRFDQCPDGHHRRVIEQGFEMGRPSFITLSFTVEGGALASVRIGGQAVRVAEGLLEA
ncbi:MAG: PhzF family phenazine biosynthesis protein [Hyphomicrobiaceae bacterium]|nr:PhzF family phenazine biosynthesis protein [Hyphomicrobiaceae bacterium]